MDEHSVQVEKDQSLKDFASFLKKNFLTELAKENIQRVRKLDIPLMRFFSHMSERELLEASIIGLNTFLTDIEEGKAVETAEKNLELWEADKLPGISQDSLEPSDLVLVYVAQKQALFDFIPKFTQDPLIIINIIHSLEDFYMKTQDAAFKLYIKLRTASAERTTKLQAEQDATMKYANELKEVNDKLLHQSKKLNIKTEELKDSNNRIEAILESINDGFYSLDNNWNFTYLNARAQNSLGKPREELIGKNIFEVLPVLNNSNFGESFKKAMNEKVMIHLEGYYSLGDAWYEIRVYPSESGLSIFFMDITERKNAEEKLTKQALDLTRSNEELQQFAYIASHDLQEPLRIISSYVQLLVRRYKSKLDDDADEFMKFILEGVNRMHSLIEDLLEYSSVDKNNNEFYKTSLEISFNQAKKNLLQTIKENEARIEADNFPELSIDQSQITQLFQNLLSNSIKYRSKNTPKIYISAIQKDNEWMFSVKDNGIGIEPQYFDKIFLIFQRLHTRSKYPGTGIGLAICKKIVEHHGGRIWVESEFGKGSTFFFTLPG